MKEERFSPALLVLVSVIAMTWSAYALGPQEKTTRENITTLMLLRMTQVLDLTEEQTALLFPKIHRIEKEKAKVSREIGIRMRELRSMLQDEDPDIERMERIIGEIKGLRNQLKATEAQIEDIVENSLTLEQRAKYLLFFQDFYKGIREKLAEARKRQERQKAKK